MSLICYFKSNHTPLTLAVAHTPCLLSIDLRIYIYSFSFGSVLSHFLFAVVVDVVTEFARGCAK